MLRTILTTGTVATLIGCASAQSIQRNAVISGRGNNDRGKCTVEVVVDGTAEVEIRGASATLRNTAGQPAQWRRFECTSAMPANPANFAFSGVDGRGRQELVRDPRSGGAAVIRIEDPQGGAEGYTFDITWNSNGGLPGVQDRTRNGYPQTPDRGAYPADSGRPYPADQGRSYPADQRPGAPADQRRDQDRGGYAPDQDRRYDRADGDRDRGGYARMSTDQAVRTCQDAVRRQAADRFNAEDLDFRRTSLNDNPGPADSVMGTFNVRRGGGRDEVYRFTCSMNFDNGRVRSVDIRPLRNGER